MNISSVKQFALIFLRQFIRTPSALFWAFGFPVVTSLLIAPAIELQPTKLYRVGVALPTTDKKSTAQNQEPPSEDLPNQKLTETKNLLRGLKTDPAFQVIELEDPSASGVKESEEYYSRLFKENELDLILAEDQIYAPNGAFSQILLRLLLGTNQQRLREEIEVKAIRVPGRRFLDWLIPGLIGLSLLTTGLFFVGTRIVEEKQSGLFQRLRLSPFQSADYVAGFYLSFLVLSFFQTLLLVTGFAVFSGFEISGSWFHFLLSGTLGGLTFGSIGFAIASCIRNTHVVVGVCNVFYFPMMFLSGVYFKTDGFPDLFKHFFDLIPLKALCDLFRAAAQQVNFLSAASEKWTVLAAWFVLSFGLSVYKIRNQSVES